MALKYVVITLFLSICMNANAEWFLRGTHNAWSASQMESAGPGTNTMQLTGVVFTAAGSFKFDRYGDWRESYGNGGNNIPVAAGTWDIKFFTDTKKWSVSAPQALASYHLRGTHNGWVEGTLLVRVGTSDNYELCVNFAGGDANGGPRFKIDPNGGWGDAIPAADYVVTTGWVKVMFNSSSKTISTQQGLAANCATQTSSLAYLSSSVAQSSQVKSSVQSSSVSASIYHLRGTFNSWVEGTLMSRVGATDNYESCVNFVAGDGNGGTRFKVDPNGGWGDAVPAADYPVAAGWVKITFNSGSKSISTQQNLAANCASQASSLAAVSSSAAAFSQSKSSQQSSSPPASIYHLRGTFNSWQEGTLMSRVGTTDSYESCVNFVAGDSNGNTRFKVDPNGGWGDAVPAADFVVSAGWVKITYNSLTKSVSAQQNLSANCTATPAISSAASSSVASGGGAYHIRGTFNNWLEGTLMKRIGTTDNYQYCVNFVGTSNRFKVDPNGGWGDSVPAADYVVNAGWVNVVFNSASRSISVQQNLTANCGLASSSASSASDPNQYYYPESAVFHVRGDFNGWAEGALLMQTPVPNVAYRYQACVDFPRVKQRIRIDQNGKWGPDVLITSGDMEFMGNGWTLIQYDRLTGSIDITGNLQERCANYVNIGGKTFPFPPDLGVPAPALPVMPFIPIHVRGTHNGFAEGTLMNQIGSTDYYMACVHIEHGDVNGGPRFRIDPNGGWGDAISDQEINVPAGWVTIGYNSTTKEITKQVHARPECYGVGYRIAGTHRTKEEFGETVWDINDFFVYVDGDRPLWKICRYFGDAGDQYGGPRFRVVAGIGGSRDEKNGPDSPPTIAAHGWTGISFAPPSSYEDPTVKTQTEFISVTTDMAPNCTGP